MVEKKTAYNPGTLANTVTFWEYSHRIFLEKTCYDIYQSNINTTLKSQSNTADFLKQIIKQNLAIQQTHVEAALWTLQGNSVWVSSPHSGTKVSTTTALSWAELGARCLG